MNRPSIIIAIDPDVDRSGVAILNCKSHAIELLNASIAELVNEVLVVYKGRTDAQIIVEAGWLNAKSSWHASNGRGAQRIAKNVGSNHQVGRSIVEFARSFGLDTVEQKPLRKSWRGKDGKITHDEIASMFRSIAIDFPSHSNQEVRDAALLALVASGLPMRISA